MTLLHPKPAIFLFFSLSFLFARSQDGAAPAAPSPDDSISAKSWYKKIAQTFGSLATGQRDAVNLANYGAFDPLNGAFKLNLFGPLNPSAATRVWFFNASGEGKIVGDNIGVLFNNSKFNTSTKLTGKVHYPLFKLSDINVSGNEIDAINYKIKVLEDEKVTRQMGVRRSSDSAFVLHSYRRDTIRMRQTIQALSAIENELRAANDHIAGLGERDTAALMKATTKAIELSAKKGSLFGDSLRLKGRVDSLAEYVQNSLSRMEDMSTALSKIDSETKKKRDSLELSISVKETNFFWITGVGSYSGHKYYRLMDSLPFNQHFREDKIFPFSLGAELNFLLYGKGKSVVAGKLPAIHSGNIGVVRMRGNDLTLFTTSEMTETKRYAQGDSTRTVATKYNVYPGTITEFRAWNLYVNYYSVIGKKKSTAVHFFPDVQFRDGGETPFNLGAGLVLNIKNGKLNTLFNLEIYGRLQDVGEALPQKEKKLLRRNEIGLNFGIPLHFPTPIK